ncbi:glycosyl transferase family 1 [Alteromonas lipolytica]|uniref:Glycosyltransferase n=2 Tax=Alteromonas lipolytica TaxID=1856405 RepID=A0A1E8FDP1_9ALTE|nr:hypothetical protein BFC17_21110 [Alteromonas lipolytica]GGF65857.1 glycosyl transferase family 1 [Alteromonas lipolytica]
MHVVHRLDIGGLEKVLLNCINSLPGDEFEHRIVTLTGHSEAFSDLLEQPVSVIDLEKRQGNDWRIFKRFYNEIRAYKPDCIHTYNLATIELQFVAWLAGVKLRVHAEHGRDIFDPTGANKKYRLLRKLLSRFITVIVPVSQDLFNWLLNDVKITPAKLKLVVNGINTQHFSPTEQHQPNRDRFVFGHVGRLAKIKNQTLMIRAFGQAARQSAEFASHCQLKLIGGGECFDELNELVKQLALTSQVHLAGPKLDMKAEYDDFDVFVMSSLAEGIPMTLLESMACEIPPLVTRVGGIPEVIDEHCGWLYESEDEQALTKLMLDCFSDPEKVRLMGENSRQRIVAEYSEEAMVEAYRQIYQGRV